MSLFTSSQFASASAQGNDWREASKAVLEKLSEAKTAKSDFNFGFLYVSDLLSEDTESILGLFKSVLGIENWIGGVGIGLCANGESLVDVPAISAMIGKFPDKEFCIFPPANEKPQDARTVFEGWMKENDPMLLCVSGDPMTQEDPALSLKTLEEMCSGFMVGGLTSSRKTHTQFAGDHFSGALCGAVFSSNIKVASTLSQGCHIIGIPHTITKCDGHDILEIDDRPAADVFEDDLRSMVIKKIDRDPDTIEIDDAALDDPSTIPEEFHALLNGEVHAAIPVSESDQDDYLVRNIINVDPDSGVMTIAQHVSNGDRLLFVHRDHDSVYEDLSAKLVALRKRIEHEYGTFEPKGALYISCVARAFNEFENGRQNEMQLIHEIMGDIPLTGFYAGGEINKARLYGYTGILTLFL